MRFSVPFVVLAAGVAVAAIGVAQAENAPSGWIPDPKTGCKVWDAAPDPEERVTWSGDCAGGMAEGKGTLQLFIGNKPGARYEGDMRNGRADGHGINTLPDGTRYEGAWRNNVAHGLGTLTKPGGEKFEGNWTNGCLKLGAAELTVGVAPQSCGFK
ncbi:MAG: hypothetical protein JSR24_19815 [Proteobacteria bacterium]|nr:hypothetical protein [Pseudomonadota bacterium]